MRKLNKFFHSVKSRAKNRRARFTDLVGRLIDGAYFKANDGADTSKRKINFHCTAWGSYVDSLFSYTIPSLLQKGNIPTLANNGYKLELTIYTKRGEHEEIVKQYDSRLTTVKEYMSVSIIPLDAATEIHSPNDLLITALLHQIERCIDEDAMMFLAPPDTIFGNCSVTNAVKTVEGKNVCLAAAHPRINQESMLASDVFTGLKRMERNIENDELVDLAFEYGHHELLNSFDNQDYNSTRSSALSVRAINDNTYSVIHNLPTIYLANFIKKDLQFFRQRERFHRWDSRWPRLLLRTGRLKFVGSSDLFFCVERTADELVMAKMEKGLLNNDTYVTARDRYAHNYVANTCCSVWRGKRNS